MKIENKKVNELVLDPNNARFNELYTGSRDNDDLIDYLIHNESAKEIAINIYHKEFYPDKALLVLKKGKKFLVKDGNRRLAAIIALTDPKKFGLKSSKKKIENLPVVVYPNKKELDKRITEEHANPLSRKWERISKALKMLEMKKKGSSKKDIQKLDPDVPALLKLANFYFKAVRISGEDLKKLLRRSKKEGGGKAVIFERLFRYSLLCGYSFGDDPSYTIKIENKNKFESYVESLVNYLEDHPSTKWYDVDREKEEFLDKLKTYGFSPLKKQASGKRKNKVRGTTKNKPFFKRKRTPLKLKKLIDECYGLQNEKNPNAKVALSRIAFEATLKYIIEKTQYKSKELGSYNHFKLAFYSKKGSKLPYTNFTKLKEKFTDLVENKGMRQAFKGFDLESLNQRIHNYQIGASPGDAETAAGNLLPLIEFMLEEVGVLLNSLETSKLK